MTAEGLRLATPFSLAFLAEQAGGQATSGKQRIMDIEPTSLHQRTPLMVGSQYEMKKLEEALG